MNNMKNKVVALGLAVGSAALSFAEETGGSSSSVEIPAVDYGGVTDAISGWVTSFLPDAMVILGIGLGIGLAIFGARALLKFLKAGGR